MKIDLTSSNATFGVPSNFTQLFQPAIVLDPQKKYKVGVRSIRIFNENPNISPTLANNTFKYSADNGATWSADLTITQGIYSVDDLSSVVQTLITNNGGVGTNIKLIPDYNTLKVYIQVQNNYQLDMQTNSFNSLIGWNAQIVSSSSLGQNLADVTNGITSYNVECNLINTNSSYVNGIQSSALLNFTPDVNPGSLISIVPFSIEYLELNSHHIQQINIQIVSNLGIQLVDLQSPITISLEIIEDK
jgi:hypothetical protein